MTLLELIKFDILRHKSYRTVVEEVAYRELLARIEIMVERNDCEESIDDHTVEDKEKHDALCSTIAQRFFKDIALYGPRVSNDVMKIVIQVMKSLKQTNVL